MVVTISMAVINMPINQHPATTMLTITGAMTMPLGNRCKAELVEEVSFKRTGSSQMPTSMSIILAAQEQQEKSWTFSEGELNPELVMNDRFSPCAKDRLISTHILVFFPPIETLSHPPEYGRLASHNYRPAALITQQDESSNKFDHFFTLEGGIESRRLFLRKPVILEKSKARLIGYPP